MSGIHLGTPNEATDIKIYSGGGDVSLNGTSASSNHMGIQWDEIGLINAGNGAISIVGSSTGGHGIELGAFGGSFELRAAGGVTIDGSTSSSAGHRGFQGIGGDIVVTGPDAIDVTGIAPDSTITGIYFNGNALAASGDIQFDGGSKGIELHSATIGKKATTSVTVSSSNVLLAGDVLNVSASSDIDTTGTLTLEPSGNDFASALTWPPPNLTVANAVSALTIGKETGSADGNLDADVTIGGATSIAGPIAIYGADLSLNGALTATSSDINLHATGSVTQTAAITTNRLSLNGTGNFALQNASNNVSVIAGGDGTTRLGNVAYRNANALEIVSINPSGIFSTGTVLIETETGDLTLSQDINTTSTSDDAIVLNAGRTASVGSKAGGDIIVSGSPTLSFGAGGRAKLFSGLESQSTGLTTLAGGDANARRGFDESSDLSGENLVDDQTYAIYRVAEGTGNLTVVGSGGDAINTTWEFSNGVIQTIDSSADIDASEIETRLASADLTVSAGNITVDDDITSNSASRLTLKAVDNITINAAKTLQTNNGDLIVWADSDNDGAGAIEVADDVTINTINGVTTPGLSGGGHIVLAGGTDNGSNGSVASDGIPDGHAASTTGNGIKLGAGNTSHTQMYSGGGDIIVRGASTANDADNSINVGLDHVGKWTADSGKGAIVVSGESANFYGINFVLPLTNAKTGGQHLSLISDKATGDAITITGVTAANTYGVVFNYENPKEILATGGGNITVAGSGSGSYGVFFQNQDILATSGTITIDGNKGILTRPEGVRFGAKDGSSITSSSSDVVISADAFQFDTPTSGFESEIDTTGSVTIEPSSASFSSLLTYPFTNLTVGSSITGLRVGKAGNSTDLTFSGSDISVAGPISIYGGFVNINANLTSTDTGDIFIKSLSNNNPSVDLQSGKTITKTSGTGTLTMQAQGRVENNGAITASGSGQLNVVLWSDFNNTKDDGGVSHTGSITTNGGHVWMGGSSSDGGTLTWNGLTVGDGPSVGSSGYNNNALDLYGAITTGGGDLFVWAGDGYSSGVDGIGSNGSANVVNTGSGDIVLLVDQVTGDGPQSIKFETTGTFTLAPNGGSFPSAFVWNPVIQGSGASASYEFDGGFEYLNVRYIDTLGGLVIGEYRGTGLSGDSGFNVTNSSDVTLSTAIDIAGPISVYGGDINLNANLTPTATGANILLKSLGTIEVQDNRSIQTNGGDLVLWANSDNLNGGNVLTGQNVTLDSRESGASTGGGHIHIGGGADTNSDGFPDDATAGIGNFTGGAAYGILFGNAAGSGVELLSGGGNITLIGGVDGNFTAAANSHGIGFFPGYTVNANAGNITFNGYANSGGAATIGIDLMTFGATSSSSITTTGNLTLNGVTTVTQGSDNLGVILNAGLTVNAGTVDITGSSDDVSVLLGAPITSTGSVSVSGGAFSINQPLTAGDISLTATGNVTQGAAGALTANNLSLNGTGNFTLQNTSNDVNTIAGGTAGARLGAVSYFNADDVTIGTVNPTGIYSSGDVLIETATGNINLTEPINTTSTTNTTTGYAGAIVLNAGKSAALGSAAGGDIIVSGNGAVTSGGINKLYSGSDAASTGLTTLAGQSNARDLVDETTGTFDPVLTGNATYALYRSGPLGEGDLTIVASGGAAENSGWVYNNGVLATTQATVNVNASDVISKLGLGALTIEANNITVDGDVVSNNANTFSLKARNNIVVASGHSIQTAAGSVVFWADTDVDDSGMVFLDAATVSTAGGHFWVGGGTTSATAWNGLTVGDGYAVGNATLSNGVSMRQTTINTAGGHLALYGKGLEGSQSSDSFNFGTYVKGIRLQDGNTIDSGIGTITMKGIARGTSGASNGVEFSQPGSDTIQSANTTANAIDIEGQSTAPAANVSNAWGVYTWNATIQATADGGGITIKGDATKQDGVRIHTDSAVLAKSGPITLIGTGYGSGANAVGVAGTVGQKAGTGVTTSSSDLIIRGDAYSISGTIDTSGALTIEPSGTSFAASTLSTPATLPADISGFTFGKPGNISGIEIESGLTVNGPITFFGKDMIVEAPLEATNAQLRFVAAAADDLTGTVDNTPAGTITADELLIENVNNIDLATHSNVNVGKFAAQGGGFVRLRNTGPLEIGSLGSVTGVSGSNGVAIVTKAGDLTVTEP
ncbi:MAG TPA: hypothetical protein VIC53_08990, partial [Wenzhouxiangella sp.]